MDLYRSFAIGFTFFAAACGSAAGVFSSEKPTSTLGTAQQPLEALIPLQGCGEVESYLRDRLVSDMNRNIDLTIEEIKKNEYGGCYYGSRGGYEDANAPPSPSAGAGGSSSSSGSSGSSGTSGGQATSTSKTNNQVAGVDEADFIKNDNKYLYVVSNKAFRIVQAWPAQTAAQIAKIPIEGEPRKLFVEGDRALVYVAVTPPNPNPNPSGSSSSSSSGSSGSSSGSSGRGECTYGYDCVPSGDGTATKVLVFDITNRAAPTKLREIDLSGSLLSARRIGNAVHTVVVDTSGRVDDVKYYPEYSADSCDPKADKDTQKAQMIKVWEDLRAKNLAAIASTNILEKLPTVKEGGALAIPACGGYFRPNIAEGTTFTSVVSLDLGTNAGNINSATVVSDPGVVMASETGLYMSVPHTRSPGMPWYGGGMEGEEQASTVHKFRVGATPSLTGYEASGIVKGRVLNQFALDEWQSNLRVATTTGHAPSEKTHSTLSILERKDKSLAVIGKVDNIAPTEDIRSVRFDGSRGFVVTFKKTDPLYVFDLGNPFAPSIAGELKIPGFSTYMHMMDAQHLLTIGYDAADQGSFAWFTGVMLQIFDVSDMKNPMLTHKEIIGTRGSSSEALNNHLAFNYYAPKNLLALPMTVCEGGNTGGGYGTTMTFSGLKVYDVTTGAGFHLKGQVTHPNTTASSSNPDDNAGCRNWRKNAYSAVKRSVIMDDFVYSVSDRRVKVNALGNLNTDIAVVSLEQ